MELRRQTLVWRNMESQINWTDEFCYCWYSSDYLAKLRNGRIVLGKFKKYEDEDAVCFESGEYVYTIDEIVEFAEL